MDLESNFCMARGEPGSGNSPFEARAKRLRGPLGDSGASGLGRAFPVNEYRHMRYGSSELRRTAEASQTAAPEILTIDLNLFEHSGIGG
jgi:hypothetical protein